MIDGPPDLVYCEGWDPWAGSPVRPLPAEIAKERDRAGEHYAALLLVGTLPVAMVELAWQSQACTVWHFDAQQRRVAKFELRRQGDDEMVLCERVTWDYAGPQCPEFDATTARRTQRCSAAGMVHDVVEPDGDAGASWHRFGAIQDGAPRRPVPAFGDVAALADLAHAMATVPRVCEPEPGGPGLGISALVAEPWQPPRPLEPGPLALMFRDGARFSVPGQGEVVIETRRVGSLQMPTGRLIAVDLDGLDHAWAFTVRVPPGTYPVELSLLRPGSGPETVVAGRLLTGAGPVAGWELALRASSDPQMLGSWGFFGFEITAGGVCLVDAGARQNLARNLQAGQLAAVRDGQVIEVNEPEIGNLIAFPAGPGAYPTWIGRTADGQVACFLTDLLRLHDAQLLP
jgi:hypothetical protein